MPTVRYGTNRYPCPLRARAHAHAPTHPRTHTDLMLPVRATLTHPVHDT